MKAAPHPNEDVRIAALRSYDILDTPKESDFDDIVRLASQICETPISVISLVEDQRQWFKAEVGLGVSETPIEQSICSHAILEGEFLEVSDTQCDGRTWDNPLTLGDKGLRFYAGTVLRSGEDLPIGTLCVLDYKPRTLTDFQRQALAVLSRQVMLQLDLRRALLRQKLLLREIDHRVKNSLAAVTSLIRLQARQINDQESRDFLAVLESRVARIGLLHDQLCRTGADGEIDFADYLQQVRDIMHDLIPDNVQIDIDAPHVTGDAAHASAIGVIASEFVMNSVKHAFPNGRDGVIRIALRRQEGGHLELLCSDNGVGGDAAAPGSGGIGLRLIDGTAAQVGGTATFTTDASGYSVKVDLPG